MYNTIFIYYYILLNKRLSEFSFFSYYVGYIIRLIYFRIQIEIEKSFKSHLRQTKRHLIKSLKKREKTFPTIYFNFKKTNIKK